MISITVASLLLMCLVSMQYKAEGAAPTKTPTYSPSTNRPTTTPTNKPTFVPSRTPTSNQPTIKPTLLPTSLSPTTRPTMHPTVTPSMVPSDIPTMVPSDIPTMHPTYIPTMDPTFDPTLAPSSTPTEDPTAQPTTEPSMDPTFAPTDVPTLPNQPSFLPTKMPTNKPTSVPSAAPTVSTVSMRVVQQVDGVSYTAYLADQASCDSVFIATISAAVGIPSNFVKNLQVSEASRRRASSTSSSTSAASPPTITLTEQHLRTSNRAVSANAVDLTYSVEVPASSGETYAQMSTQLTNSVESGQFTALLQSNAATQNVPALTSASSSSVVTEDTTPGGPNSGGGDKDTFTIGVIVGIAAGLFVVPLIIIYLSMYHCKWRTDDTDEAQAPNLVALHNQASAPPAAGPPAPTPSIHASAASAGSGSGGTFGTTKADNSRVSYDNPMRASRRSVDVVNK